MQEETTLSRLERLHTPGCLCEGRGDYRAGGPGEVAADEVTHALAFSRREVKRRCSSVTEHAFRGIDVSLAMIFAAETSYREPASEASPMWPVHTVTQVSERSKPGHSHNRRVGGCLAWPPLPSGRSP